MNGTCNPGGAGSGAGGSRWYSYLTAVFVSRMESVRVGVVADGHDAHDRSADALAPGQEPWPYPLRPSEIVTWLEVG